MTWFGKKEKADVVVEGKNAAGDDVPNMDEMNADGSVNERAQDLMSDNMDIMRDIVFRIREDPEFAKLTKRLKDTDYLPIGRTKYNLC